LVKDAFLYIQDKEVNPPKSVTGRISCSEVKNKAFEFIDTPIIGRQQDGNPAGLLFPLGDMAPGSSVLFSYSVGSILATVSGDLLIKQIEGDKNKNEHFIDIVTEKPIQQKPVTLKVTLVENTKTILNNFAELIYLDSSSPLEGHLSEDKHVGTWIINPNQKINKIRIQLK
jgi:hypothetical protein